MDNDGFGDVSPYAPPQHVCEPRNASARHSVDTLCYVINFTFSTLFFIACAVSVGTAESPFAFIGGLVFVLPVACYVLAEWLCWYRKRHWLLRPLGVLNLLMAAFVVFALVVNVSEALMSDEQIGLGFLVFFGVFLSFVAGYLAWCGWRRIRARSNAPEVI